jgi:hypothetical protein
MWKILKKVILILAVFLMFTNCRKESIPSCEIEGYGWVTIVNKTGYDASVDVTWIRYDENFEVFLGHNEQFTYDEIPSGRIKVWITFNSDEWYYEVETLSFCEDMTFTWYPDIKKSADCPFLLDIGNGMLVKPVLGER